MAMKLDHRRLKLAEAQAFIAAHHRHSPPLRRHFFSIGAFQAYRELPLLGVATVDVCSSHAWSRRPDHIELRRLCTLGDENVSSFLIGKVCQAVFAIGYRCLVTYTQPHESGASLRATGFVIQKRARMIQTTSGKIRGGLVQWVKGRDWQPSAADREWTKEILGRTHRVFAEWQAEAAELEAKTGGP